MIILSFYSVSDFTLPTGTVLRTSIPAMEAVTSNFPGNINCNEVIRGFNSSMGA